MKTLIKASALTIVLGLLALPHQAYAEGSAMLFWACMGAGSMQGPGGAPPLVACLGFAGFEIDDPTPDRPNAKVIQLPKGVVIKLQNGVVVQVAGDPIPGVDYKVIQLRQFR